MNATLFLVKGKTLVPGLKQTSIEMFRTYAKFLEIYTLYILPYNIRIYTTVILLICFQFRSTAVTMLPYALQD